MKYVLLFIPMLAFGQVYEELTVTYKDIRVHVVDSNGDPVKGLKLDDFVLTVNRDDKEVDYFEEVDLAVQVAESEVKIADAENGKAQPVLEAAPETVDRFMVLFFDSSHMTPSVFKSVKEAMLRFIEERVASHDFVKIVQMDRRFEHVTGFTKDKDALKQGIEKTEYRGSLRKDVLKAQRGIDNMIEEWDNAPVDIRYTYENGINQFIKEKARIKADYYRTFYYNMLRVGNMLENIKGAKSIFLFSGGGYLEHNSGFGGTIYDSDQLGRVLNRADATVYTMYFGSPNPLGGGGRTLNLKSVDPGFASRLKNYSVFPPTDQFTEIASNTIVEDNRQIETGPSATAENTGGLYLRTYNARTADEQLKRLNDVSRHYYRLGFAVDNPRKSIKVKVRLKDKERGWQLLYGKQFEPNTPYLELKKDERDIAFRAMLLYGQVFRDDLEAEWDHHLFPRATGGYRVSLQGKIPAGAMPGKGYELGFAVLDEIKEPLDLTTTVLSELPEGGTTFRFYEVMLTEKRPKFLRASIRDLDTGDYSFRHFEIADEPSVAVNKPRLSEIIMTAGEREAMLAINHLRIKNDADAAELELHQARKLEDPFKIGDRYFVPGFRPYQFKPGAQWFLFHLINPLPGKHQVQFLIQSKSGYHQAPGRIAAEFREGEHEVHIQGALNTTNLPPGAYTLWVRVVYPGEKEPIMGKTEFSIMNDDAL